MKEKEAFYFVACNIIKNNDVDSIVRMLDQLCKVRIEVENSNRIAANAQIFYESKAQGSSQMGVFSKGISFVTNKISKIIDGKETNK